MKKHLWILTMLIGMCIAQLQAQVTLINEGFENGVPTTWTLIDADGDNNNWTISSYDNDPLWGAHSGSGYLFSSSYDDVNYQALTPDNWIVMSPVTLGGTATLTFWRCVSRWYPEEHYGVYVSTTSPTDLTSFTLVFEETPTVSTYGWREKIVDLSAYANSTVYIAFRHFNSTEEEALGLDDITVTSTTSLPTISVTPTQMSFDNAVMGCATQSQLLTVGAYNLTAGVTAVASAPFQVSADNSIFAATATLPDTGGVLYVRYFPMNPGTDNGTLTLSSGTTTTTVTLTGSNVDCSFISLPYEQNFDNIAPGALPMCWQRVNPYANYGLQFPAVSESQPHGNSGHSLEFESDNMTGTPSYVVLPLMPQNISSLQISFWSRREGNSSGTFSVGYMTDLSNTNTFVPVWSTTGPNASSTYEPVSVSFANVPVNLSQNYYIAFRYQTNTYYFWYVDDVIVEEISGCPRPTDLSVGYVMSHSATLSWNSTASSHVVFYKPTAATEWDSIPNVTLGSAGYVLDNLLANTSYEWYVASVCSDGSLSNSMGTGSFVTDCEAFAVPFTENFDANSGLPACWSRMTGMASEVFAGHPATPVSTYWVFSRQQVFGQYHPVLNIYGSSCKHWLVSPAIDLGTLTNPILTFDLALTLYNSEGDINPHDQLDDKFMVVVSTDNGVTWSAANATVWSNDGMGDYVFNQIPASGQEVTIPLAAYANQTVKIAFYGESTVEGNGDNDLHIDNVMVIQGSSCTKPSQLTVNNVDSNFVTLGWTEMGDATSWNIKYGPVGFDVEDSTAMMVTTNANPFTVTNLSAGVPYDFYVQAVCSNEPSLWVGPVAAAPGSYNMPANGADTVVTCAMAIYDNGGMLGDYNSSCNGILVVYPAIEGNFVELTGSYETESNCDFLRVYDGVGTNGTLLDEFSGNGTVPVLVAASGPMTIQFISDNAVQGSGFELFVSCTDCAPPANVTISELTATTAELDWDNNGALVWMVQYKAENDTVWATMTTSDTTINLVGLDPLTTYVVQVASECGTGYSDPVVLTFATPMHVAQLPYSTDFNENSDRNWTLNNGTCTNHWMMGSVNDSVSALFITPDNTNASYNTESFSVVSAEKLFTVGQTNEVLISFDVKVGGEGTFDYLKAFFAPASATYPAATGFVTYANSDYSEYAIDFTEYLQYSGSGSEPYMFNLTSGNTVHVMVSMPNPNPNPTANSTGKLVFLWKNDQSTGTNPGAIIYNVSVAASTCSTPANLTVSNINSGTADIAWTSEASAWNLEYKEADATTWTSVTVTGTPSYQLTGLTAGAVYNVRVQAVCGANDVSYWKTATFATPCDAINTFPYTEGFEHNGAMPECWNQEHEIGMASWTAQSGNYGSYSTPELNSAHSGDFNAYFFNVSSATTKLITPPFDLTSLTNPYITYWFSHASWGSDIDHLIIYYRTSPVDEWHVLSQHFSSVASWTMDSLQLPAPSASYQLAFEGISHYGYGITLDDITIWGDTTTPIVLTEPTATTDEATNVEQTSATLNGSISNPDNVAITAQGFEWRADNGNYVAVNVPGVTMTYNLTGLTANTNYTYRAFVTTANGTHYGQNKTFTTQGAPVGPCETPTGLATSDITSESITLTWDAADNVENWNVLYRPVNGQNTVITSNTNTYTITGLNPATTYEIQVRANCGGDEVSPWTAIATVTTLVGLNSYLENNVTLYPNPANEYIDVRVDGDVDVTGMEVYDVYGKLIRTVVGANNDSSTRINVSDLSAGMYFVRVTTEQGVVTKRFVKK